MKFFTCVMLATVFNLLALLGYHLLFHKNSFNREENQLIINVGQLNLRKGQIEKNKEISVFGYLFENRGKYFISPNESYSSMEPMIQESIIVELMNIKNDFRFDLDETCLNKNVIVKGYLDKKLNFKTIKTDTVRTIENNREHSFCFIK